MNILQITLGFYPAASWGGPVKIVYENSKELIRRGHQVTVYCTNLLDKKHHIEPGTFERQVDGIRVVYFHTLSIPSWPGTLGPIWLPDLGPYLNREVCSFDIIHINGYRNLMNLDVTKAARKKKIPFMIQPHGALPVIVNSQRVKRLYDHLLGKQELQGLGALIALQASEKQQALEYGIPEEKIRIIPNGLNLSNQPKAPKGSFREKNHIPKDVPVILFLARINKKKGVDLLVESFAQMHDLDAHLVIAGPDDGQLDEVKSLISKYNLERRVCLPGLLSGEEIAAVYQDANLFVLPCRTDTFPTTIMEACFYNLPMVITDRCESADIVKDRIADVVPFDVQSFSSAMCRLLTDDDHYHTYQMNCPELMEEQFSVKSTVDRLENLYQEVIDESKNN